MLRLRNPSLKGTRLESSKDLGGSLILGSQKSERNSMTGKGWAERWWNKKGEQGTLDIKPEGLT